MNRDLGGLGRHGGRLRIGLADVDTALEERAIFNADASCGHIAGEGAFRTDVHAVSGIDVALELAENDDLAGADAGRDIAVLAHGDAIAGDLMLPSTLPSMNRDSVPVISPLMERPLLMLACSPTEDAAARVFQGGLHRHGASKAAARVSVSERGIGLVGWVST